MNNEMWAFFCMIGFWGWVMCTTGFIVRSFSKANSFSRKPATVWGSALILFYCLWVVGMINA